VNSDVPVKEYLQEDAIVLIVFKSITDDGAG
jgi:hypothetical protein